MKHIINKLIILSAVLGAVSCNDYLNVPPYGKYSDDFVANRNGVDLLLISAYSTLDGLGNAKDWYIWNNWWSTDDARFGSNMGVSNFDAFMLTPTENNIDVRWRTLYGFINRSNVVLEMLPKVTDMTEDEKVMAAAQARFIRGFNYLYLAIIWKNVPWIDENVNYGDRSYLASNTAVNIYEKIEEDFKFAAEKLPETWPQVGRVNSWAAKSFLAKTYMFEKKFAEAKALLDDIIANGKTTNNLKYDLVPRYADNFRNKTRNNCESVFAIQMSVHDGIYSGLNGNPMAYMNGTYNAPANTGFGWYQPTFDLVDAFQTDPNTGLPLIDDYYKTPIKTDFGISSTDPFTPYEGTLDARLDWCVGRRGIPYLDWGNHLGKAWVRNQNNGGPYSSIKHACEKKYVETDRVATNKTNTPYCPIRFADVLLWAAECEVEVGSLAKAEAYVNRVRERAANPAGFVKKMKADGTFSNTPAANYKVGLYTGQFTSKGQDFARKAVRFERRLELAMEYHRYYDMLRYDGNHFDLAEHVNTFLKREGNRLKPLSPNTLYLQGSFVKGKNELFPIPQVEIDLSLRHDGTSALTQNPNW